MWQKDGLTAGQETLVCMQHDYNVNKKNKQKSMNLPSKEQHLKSLVAFCKECDTIILIKEWPFYNFLC